jgi:hypothetical protein
MWWQGCNLIEQRRTNRLGKKKQKKQDHVVKREEECLLLCWIFWRRPPKCLRSLSYDESTRIRVVQFPQTKNKKSEKKINFFVHFFRFFPFFVPLTIFLCFPLSHTLPRAGTARTDHMRSGGTGADE